jgi:hypothetical protein
MDFLRFIPWIIGVILIAILLIGGYEYLSILQSINGHPGSKTLTPGKWFVIALVALAFIAFAVLFLVSLLNI